MNDRDAGIYVPVACLKTRGVRITCSVGSLNIEKAGATTMFDRIAIEKREREEGHATVGFPVTKVSFSFRSPPTLYC